MTDRWKVMLILLVCSLSVESALAAYARSSGTKQSYTKQLTERLVNIEPKIESPMRGHQTHPRRGGTRLSTGIWGGEHISLQVTEGGATIEYDCAHGTISRGILVDRRGRFVVEGTHVEEHGGPVRVNEQLNGYPVQFTGRVSGKRLKLTVKRRDTTKIIGIFTLSYGQEASLVKCR